MCNSARTWGAHAAVSSVTGPPWSQSRVRSELLNSARTKGHSGQRSPGPLASVLSHVSLPSFWLHENSGSYCHQKGGPGNDLGMADHCLTSCCTPLASSDPGHQACSVCTRCPARCAAAPAYGPCARPARGLGGRCPFGLLHHLSLLTRPFRPQLRSQLLREAMGLAFSSF